MLAAMETAGEMGSDANLVAAALRRDANAFAQLMQRHAGVVYGVVWRMTRGHPDCEDMAQEAFLRLWNDPEQLRDANKVKSWLVRVASNIAMDRLRAKPMALVDETFADESADAEAQMEKHHVAQRMDKAIAGLPDRQRLALTLVSFENFTNQAAADVMEITVDALEGLVRRARQQLKQDLAGEWQELLAGLAE